MNFYEISFCEYILEQLVIAANMKNMNLENKNKYIEFIYKVISHYFLSMDPYKVSINLDSYVNIIYNSEKYGEKTYRIFFPWYREYKFYIPENIHNVECPTVNFSDVINYYKEENLKKQLKNIKNVINELLNHGLTIEKIETQIKSILYKEKENHKQKVKRPQK